MKTINFMTKKYPSILKVLVNLNMIDPTFVEGKLKVPTWYGLSFIWFIGAYNW